MIKTCSSRGNKNLRLSACAPVQTRAVCKTTRRRCQHLPTLAASSSSEPSPTTSCTPNSDSLDAPTSRGAQPGKERSYLLGRFLPAVLPVVSLLLTAALIFGAFGSSPSATAAAADAVWSTGAICAAQLYVYSCSFLVRYVSCRRDMGCCDLLVRRSHFLCNAS